MHPTPRLTDRLRRPAAHLAVALVVTGAVGLAACGADEQPDLSAAAARGRDVAAGSGCAGCHGGSGEGGVGPAWTGLAGSTVQLDDGSTVTADADYLHRSIVDPGAEVVAGYTLQMPQNQLSDDEAAAVVAYIQELG